MRRGKKPTRKQFLSTPSARRATPAQLYTSRRAKISIHALREEGDHSFPVLTDDHINISIHALREEGDGWDLCSRPCGNYFYPRPPRGGRPFHC